jgi:chromosome transmission fidelity protein 4
MCWNTIGIVKGMVDEGKGLSSIIVDFHDITIHHTIQLPNQQDYTLADLSERALILASQGKEKDVEGGEDERSIIKVLNYKTWWDKNKEWTTELPKGEFAECVTGKFINCTLACLYY